ncbi:unnamed protein product [Symbiodinium microadriaticum]|nr:unnamed protein product [Symbiodinium microadriaticum]
MSLIILAPYLLTSVWKDCPERVVSAGHGAEDEEQRLKPDAGVDGVADPRPTEPCARAELPIVLDGTYQRRVNGNVGTWPQRSMQKQVTAGSTASLLMFAITWARSLPSGLTEQVVAPHDDAYVSIQAALNRTWPRKKRTMRTLGRRYAIAKLRAWQDVIVQHSSFSAAFFTYGHQPLPEYGTSSGRHPETNNLDQKQVDRDGRGGNVESSNESDAVLQNHAQPLEKQPGDMEQWKSGIRSASDQFLFWFSRGKALKSASDCRT